MKNWYREQEQRREDANREAIQPNFVFTFSFENERVQIYTTLKLVKDKIFEEPKVKVVTTYQKKQTIIQLLHYYHVIEEQDPPEENPHNTQIPEVEGQREVEGLNLDS